MDMNQVRARIVETGRIVKQALLERGIDVPDQEPGYKYINGVALRRRCPFWSEERGFKYIDDVDDHLRRLSRSLEFLNPQGGSSVFEIGPGSCFFLFICRELRGCQVAGIDWKRDDESSDEKATRMPFHELQQYAFRLFRERLGLEGVVKHQVVTRYQPIEFDGHYDHIVATRAMFNHGWGEREYRFWLRDCYQHLRPDGKLMVHFNEVDPQSLAALPILRPANPSRGVKKLNLIPREMIESALAAQDPIDPALDPT
jgi:SAM-dependent methyltransferase